MNRSTKILIGVGILVVGLFAISLLTTKLTTSKKGSVTITVSVSPKDSTFTVDGKTTAAGKISLSSGTHNLVASHQYFTTVSKTIDTKTVNTSQTIYLSPTPDSDQAKQWLLDHPIAQQQREAAAGQQSAQEQEQLLAKSSLVQMLPYQGYDFSIDYGASIAHPNDPSAVGIYISQVDDTGKTNALNWIKAMGYDPANYEIIYTGGGE